MVHFYYDNPILGIVVKSKMLFSSKVINYGSRMTLKMSLFTGSISQISYLLLKLTLFSCSSSISTFHFFNYKSMAHIHRCTMNPFNQRSMLSSEWHTGTLHQVWICMHHEKKIENTSINLKFEMRTNLPSPLTSLKVRHPFI